MLPVLAHKLASWIRGAAFETIALQHISAGVQLYTINLRIPHCVFQSGDPPRFLRLSRTSVEDRRRNLWKTQRGTRRVQKHKIWPHCRRFSPRTLLLLLQRLVAPGWGSERDCQNIFASNCSPSKTVNAMVILYILQEHFCRYSNIKTTLLPSFIPERMVYLFVRGGQRHWQILFSLFLENQLLSGLAGLPKYTQLCGGRKM